MDERVVILLEEIAFQLSPKAVEKQKYLENLYASRLTGATAIYGDLRTQSTARQGEVSEPKSGERILWDPNQGPPRAQKAKDKNDKGVKRI
jgi:hypothetical protein